MQATRESLQREFSLFRCKRLFARRRCHSGAFPLYREKLLRLRGARFLEKDYEGSHQETNAQNESRESERLRTRCQAFGSRFSYRHVRVLFNVHEHGARVRARARIVSYERTYAHLQVKAE